MTAYLRGLLGLLMLAVIAFTGPLWAGEVQVGGQGGTTDPPPNPPCGAGCDLEVDWNPHVVCPVTDPVTDIDDDLDAVLTCMLNEPQRAAEDFSSALLAGGVSGPWGIVVTRNTGEPLERLKIKENFAGFATTQVIIDNDDMVVQIAKIIEDPNHDGVITIVLDDDPVEYEQPDQGQIWTTTISTTQYPTQFLLNAAISTWLLAAGFDTPYDPDYFVASRSAGFRRVQFRSTDSGVLSSEIALMIDEDPEVETLFHKGPFF